MSTVYAIQFDVVPCADGDVLVEYEQIKKRIADWVVAGYARKWNKKVDFPRAGEREAPLPDHSIEVSDVAIGGSEMRQTRWQHPDGVDDHLRWATEIVVARTGEHIQFGVRLEVSSTAYVVRPTQISLGRPRLVSELLEKHSCWVGKQPLLAKTVDISSGDVEAFVNEQLLFTERSIPIVIVSHDRFTERPVLNAAKLHDSLRGFAQVAVLDKWAAFRLTELVGRPLSCFNGCVRIYWPGLARDSNPLYHRLYFPSQIMRLESQKRPLSTRLFQLLSQISATRFTDASIVREIQSRVEAERKLESVRIQKQLQDGRADASSLQEAKELLDVAIKENTELNAQVSSLVAENETLTAQLRGVQENFNIFQQHQGIEADEIPQPDEAPQVEFESVAMALDAAQHDLSDLFVLDDAIRSAQQSQFARPDLVYQALMAIRDVGREYFASLDEGSPMGSWKDQLAKRNFTHYSQTESATVKNDHRRYGRYREFNIDGQKRQVYQHLDLGGGDRKNCLQIYFEADTAPRRVVIAYCGPHLPFPRQRT